MSVGLCAFIPKYQFFPFFAWCISGSRLSLGGWNSENNLVCGFYRDYVIPRIKIIKHKVVMRDDIRCGQNSVVSHKVGIACERNVITETRSTSASGINTILGHSPSNDEVGNASFSKFPLKFCLEEFPSPLWWSLASGCPFGPSC
jgi:hypothetical protein